MSVMYKVCKRIIMRGDYPEDMVMRINVFYGAALISTEEYNELINLIK